MEGNGESLWLDERWSNGSQQQDSQKRIPAATRRLDGSKRADQQAELVQCGGRIFDIWDFGVLLFIFIVFCFVSFWAISLHM